MMLSGNNYSRSIVSLETNEFYLQFPFCQIGHLQWIRQPNFLAYNDDNTMVGYRASQAWWTITTEKFASSGIVSFTFYIHRLNRKNLFLGLSRRSVSVAGFLGSTEYSWGLMASGTIWYNSRRQKFCRELRTKDLVKFTINFNNGTLAITLNNEYLGVAFRNLPRDQALMPGVSFYDAGDIVELVNYKVCATKYSSSDIDIHYVDTDYTKDIASVRQLSSVPENRMNLAKQLEGMGFALEECILALEAVNDNLEVAVDYIFSHKAELKQKASQKTSLINQAEKNAQKRPTIDWFINAFLEDEKQKSMRRLPWICLECYTGNNFTENKCVKCGKEKPDYQSEEMLQKNKSRWGFRLHVLPDYSAERLLSLRTEMIANNQLQLPGMEKWTTDLDHELIEMITEYCDQQSCDISTLFPGNFFPPDQLYMKHPNLAEFSVSQLQIRFYLLQQLNLMVTQAIRYINISCDDGWDPTRRFTCRTSILAKYLRSLRGLIFRPVKIEWLQNVGRWFEGMAEAQVLKRSEYASHTSISLNRQLAVQKKDGEMKDEYTMFYQFFQSANSLPPDRFRDGTQPFTIQFKGEYGDDAGGLFREAMTIIFKEIQSNPLTLFIPSPNGRMDYGRERDVFIPNPRSTTTLCIQMYEFLGKMIGVMIRTRNTVPLNLADLFWKRLVGIDITVNDIQNIDQEFISVESWKRGNA